MSVRAGCNQVGDDVEDVDSPLTQGWFGRGGRIGGDDLIAWFAEPMGALATATQQRKWQLRQGSCGFDEIVHHQAQGIFAQISEEMAKCRRIAGPREHAASIEGDGTVKLAWFD